MEEMQNLKEQFLASSLPASRVPWSTRCSGDRRAGDGLSHIDTSSQNEKSCLTPQEEVKGARV